MDPLSTCKICFRDFLDEAQENSLEYRKTIIETGSVNLFDELVVWSSLSNNEPLPFCPFCIESIEKIKTLSNECNKVKGKIDAIASRLTVDSLRTRKVVKTSGDLLAKVLEKSSRDVKVPIKHEEGEGAQLNSNCVLCYSKFLEGKTCPEFSSRYQKKKMLKSCTLHLMEALRNNEFDFDWETLPERMFTPFCKKCLVAIVRIGELNSKFQHAGDKLYSLVNSFTIESLKLKTTNAKKRNTIYGEQERQGGGNENGSGFEVDDTTNTIEVIEFLTSDEDEDNVVMNDPLMTDANLNTLTDNTIDASTSTHRIFSTSTVTYPMSTSIYVTVPTHAANVTSRHESPPLQNQSMDSAYYDYREYEEPIEGEATLTTARIITNVLESAFSPQHPSSSRKSLLGSSTSREGTAFPDVQMRAMSGVVFACPNCNEIFFQEDNLANHMIQCGTNHQENQVLDGMPSLVDYSHYPDVQISEYSETLNVSPASSDCGEKFDTGRRLNKHVAVALHANPQIFTCKQCGKSFEHKILLRNHTQGKNACKDKSRAVSAKSKRVSTFQCTFCPAQLTNALELSQHYQCHYDV